MKEILILRMWPSIKHVSLFPLFLTTPSHISQCFYTYESSLFPQFLAPFSLSLKSDDVDVRVLYGWPLS